MYSIYPSTMPVNPASVHPSWQFTRSPQYQQQPIDQQRNYGNGRNSTSQQASSISASNTGGRSISTTIPSGQTGATNSDGSSFSPQYTLNGAIPNAYAYGGPTGWISAPQQMSSPHTNMSSQINATYNIMFDPSQQPAYLHRNLYDTLGFLPQQLQAPAPSSQQQAPPQPGLDTVPQGNYNR